MCSNFSLAPTGAADGNYYGDLLVSVGVHSHLRNSCLVSKHQSNFNKPTSAHTSFSSPQRNRICENEPNRPPSRRNQKPQDRWASQDDMLPKPSHFLSIRPHFLLCRHHSIRLRRRRKHSNHDSRTRSVTCWLSAVCWRCQGGQKRSPHGCSALGVSQ